jgi:peptidoglycan/xylan/chitin deacetylase (PgdA/CDA1 family)
MLDRRLLKTALGRIAGLSGAYARAFQSTMVSVAFHRVNDQMAGDSLTCGSAKFAAFCRFFRSHARVVSLGEQVAGCNERRDMRGTVSITFDDGYRDNFEVAAPILRDLQLPATFFITTGFIGSQVIAPWDAALVRQPGWMTWDNVRALASQGFEIGAHTHTHVDMGSADAATLRADLLRSRQAIQRELGLTVRLFAYPFGGREHITDAALALVRELGYECCASGFGGLNPPGTSPYELRRIPIAEWFTTPHQFGFEFLRGGFRLHEPGGAPPGAVAARAPAAPRL